MNYPAYQTVLETKFVQAEADIKVTDGSSIEGYASLVGLPDQGGDVVQASAYTRSLERLAQKGHRVKMLWQHDPAQPIGVWDEVYQDEKGLYVKGRILTAVAKGREAAALIEAGAIDGLSIGYRTKRAEKDAGGHRLLHELELWEVSLVTFPMLPEARVGSKGDTPEDPNLLQELAEAIEAARRDLAGD